MPLKKGKSKKIISKNIKEMIENPSAKTNKAASTLAKRRGISKKEALIKIASAAAFSMARKSGAKIAKKKKRKQTKTKKKKYIPTPAEKYGMA